MSMPGMIAMPGMPGGIPNMFGQPMGIVNPNLLQPKKEGSKDSKDDAQSI